MRTHIALRVGVLSMLAREPTSPSMLAREPTSPRDLGKRRLVTRGEIKRVAAGAACEYRLERSLNRMEEQCQSICTGFCVEIICV